MDQKHRAMQHQTNKLDYTIDYGLGFYPGRRLFASVAGVIAFGHGTGQPITGGNS